MRENVKVLLVDDETEFTDVTVKLLETRGIMARAVHCGQDALDELEDGDYDVMVLDLNMPGMDGLMTLRRMNGLRVHPKVLVLTGHGTVDTAIEAVESGAHDYLAKPCGIEELVHKIESAVAASVQGEPASVDAGDVSRSRRAATSLFRRRRY